MRQRGPHLSLDTDFVITPVAEPSVEPAIPPPPKRIRVEIDKEAALAKLAELDAATARTGMVTSEQLAWHRFAQSQVPAKPLPPWMPSNRRADLDVLADSDVEWIDRQWRDAGGTEVTGFITTEPVAGPPLWFFAPLMAAVVVLGAVGAVVVALR